MSFDPGSVFRLDVSALELVIRTSLVYLALLTAMRVISRREMGSLELPDLLMVVLIADGVQNGMAGNYNSFTGALIVAGTIIGWNYALDALSYRFGPIRRLIRPAPLPLVKDGRLLRRNMRRELISLGELQSQLRAQGVENLNEVRLACLEPDGELSVLKAGGDEQQPRPHREQPAH